MPHQTLRTAALAAALSGCALLPTRPPAPPLAAGRIDPRVLIGAWTVDLRAAPTAAPYSQPFVVDSVDEAARSLRGSFYRSEISWSRINTAWGKLVISFITSDGRGEYVHTATLQGGVLVGTSTAKHRDLLVPWTATRAVATSAPCPGEKSGTGRSVPPPCLLGGGSPERMRPSLEQQDAPSESFDSVRLQQTHRHTASWGPAARVGVQGDRALRARGRRLGRQH